MEKFTEEKRAILATAPDSRRESAVLAPQQPPSRDCSEDQHDGDIKPRVWHDNRAAFCMYREMSVVDIQEHQKTSESNVGC